MKRKWIILTVVIILGIALILGWQKQSKLKAMGNILESVSVIDSIVIKDGETKEEIFTLANSDSLFPEMVDVYHFYYDLKWSERKLLKGDAFIEIDYLKSNDVQFTIGIFEVEDSYIARLPTTGGATSSFSYSPVENDATYIFAIKEISQLTDANEGMKELLNELSNN